jgi:hypothetical protein
MTEHQGEVQRRLEATLIEHVTSVAPRPFGVAVGVTAAGLVFLVTAYHVVSMPVAAVDLALLEQYFYGYRVSWSGAVVGAGWGGLYGYVAGAFVASVHNAVVLLWLRIVRARAELVDSGDVLDHF